MTFTLDVPISGVSVMLKLVAASLVVAPPMIANAAMAETMARSRARPQYAFIFPPHPFYPRPDRRCPAITKYHKGGGCTSLRLRGWDARTPGPGRALTSQAVDRSRQSS